MTPPKGNDSKTNQQVSIVMDVRDYTELEQKLQYTFRSKELLQQALRHSSFVNEQIEPDLQDNERLEFLGDAVLNLIIGHLLWERYPELHEGDLSKTRARLVNASQLGKIARSLYLGAYIKLGKGEVQTNGREKNSILADTFEALVAAVYLDGGFKAAFELTQSRFETLLDNRHALRRQHDYKSELQELVQLSRRDIPSYRIVQDFGPDHDKTFAVQLDACGIQTLGFGKSKKMAEQDAARKALEILKQADTQKTAEPRMP
jgi:ribonuclease-3